MSSDNGIYIGEFPDNTWRVIEASAIDNLDYDKQKYPGCDMNPYYVLSYYQNAKVYTNKTVTTTVANNWEKEILNSNFPYLEYGVSTIKFQFTIPQYRDFAKKYRDTILADKYLTTEEVDPVLENKPKGFTNSPVLEK